MTAEELLEQTSQQCESYRLLLMPVITTLSDFGRRLLQINQQIRKNVEVRDNEFTEQFNNYVAHLRSLLDKREPVWTELRNQIRQVPPSSWTADLALDAKGLNSRAKALSRACDDFNAQYDIFCKHYKNFTAAKLNVWLLTACQNDITSLTEKILLLAREIARQTEQKRSPHAE
ncbi:MAG: hypothetical protein J6Y25_04950 [Elusimicrobiaceae bacterium]|nr:hypothetical protein [Elusimicrobiaceae bacterium]